MVMVVELSVFIEVSLVRLVMCLKWCLSGVVIDDVMVLGLVLGRVVDMEMVGKFICGSGEMGRW